MPTAWNTFARQAAFVPFVLETLHYLAGPAARALPAELVVADAPDAARGRPGDRPRRRSAAAGGGQRRPARIRARRA